MCENAARSFKKIKKTGNLTLPKTSGHTYTLMIEPLADVESPIRKPPPEVKCVRGFPQN